MASQIPVQASNLRSVVISGREFSSKHKDELIMSSRDTVYMLYLEKGVKLRPVAVLGVG